MKVDRKLVRTLRLEKSWSQELLAEKAGLNLRTIQRIESNGAASLRARRLIAAALGVDVTVLNPQDGTQDRAATEASKPTATNSGRRSVLADLYALSAVLLFAFVVVDQLYARSIDAQGLSVTSASVFSKVADFLLVFTFVSMLIAIGAIGVVWRHTSARWLFISSVILGLIWPAALPLVGNSIVPGLWLDLHESGAGPILRFSGQALAAAFALWGWIALSRRPRAAPIFGQ